MQGGVQSNVRSSTNQLTNQPPPNSHQPTTDQIQVIRAPIQPTPTTNQPANQPTPPDSQSIEQLTPLYCTVVADISKLVSYSRSRPAASQAASSSAWPRPQSCSAAAAPPQSGRGAWAAWPCEPAASPPPGCAGSPGRAGQGRVATRTRANTAM